MIYATLPPLQICRTTDFFAGPSGRAATEKKPAYEGTRRAKMPRGSLLWFFLIQAVHGLQGFAPLCRASKSTILLICGHAKKNDASILSVDAA